jgi:hypothetical protein
MANPPSWLGRSSGLAAGASSFLPDYELIITVGGALPSPFRGSLGQFRMLWPGLLVATDLPMSGLTLRWSNPAITFAWGGHPFASREALITILAGLLGAIVVFADTDVTASWMGPFWNCL